MPHYAALLLLLLLPGSRARSFYRQPRIMTAPTPTYIDRKWPNAYTQPITYMLVRNEHMKENVHNVKNFREVIVSAFRYWAASSDIRFLEVPAGLEKTLK